MWSDHASEALAELAIFQVVELSKIGKTIDRQFLGLGLSGLQAQCKISLKGTAPRVVGMNAAVGHHVDAPRGVERQSQRTLGHHGLLFSRQNQGRRLVPEGQDGGFPSRHFAAGRVDVVRRAAINRPRNGVVGNAKLAQAEYK